MPPAGSQSPTAAGSGQQQASSRLLRCRTAGCPARCAARWARRDNNAPVRAPRAPPGPRPLTSARRLSSWLERPPVRQAARRAARARRQRARERVGGCGRPAGPSGACGEPWMTQRPRAFAARSGRRAALRGAPVQRQRPSRCAPAAAWRGCRERTFARCACLPACPVAHSTAAQQLPPSGLWLPRSVPPGTWGGTAWSAPELPRLPAAGWDTAVALCGRIAAGSSASHCLGHACLQLQHWHSYLSTVQ